jgi:hypothetical protein
MMRCFAVAISLMIASMAGAADVNIEAFALRSKAERADALSSAKASLAELRKRNVWAPGQRKHTIESIEARIAALEDPFQPYFARSGIDLASASVGELGWLDAVHVEVFQVIDDRNAIVRYVWQVVLREARLAAVEYGSTAPDRSQPAIREEHDRRYWLKGKSTSGWHDEMSVTLTGLFAVTETKTYDTLASQSTVPVLEPIDIAAHLDKFTRKDEAREWTSASGGHKTIAVFIGYERGAATLVRLDGKRLRLPLAKLSEADRKFILEKNAAAKR